MRRTARLILAALVGVASLSIGLVALAQEDGPVVEVIDISGVVDERVLQFAIDSIDRAAAGNVEVVILEVDSRAVVGELATLDELVALIADPPVPVVTWVGPSPAVASGGAVDIVAAAPIRFAAPGSLIGNASPRIAGDASTSHSDMPVSLLSGLIPVEDVGGFFTEVSDATASPRQVAQLLDGVSVTTSVGEVAVTTIEEFVAEDGTSGVTVLPTIIRSPGWWDQFLRLASTPEAAFFFLVVALTVAAFEFYAIGPGIAAAVAAVCLILAGYGIAVLPVRWWAVVLTVLAVWILAASYQMGGVLALSVVGMAGLAVAGFSFTDAAPQLRPGVPGVLLAIAVAGFFFLLAMPTVARSRFSTQTIGREELIGAHGTAVTDIDPDGEVEVNGARWPAGAHREAGLRAGDAIVVTAVEGLRLEVDRVDSVVIGAERPDSDRE